MFHLSDLSLERRALCWYFFSFSQDLKIRMTTTTTTTTITITKKNNNKEKIIIRPASDIPSTPTNYQDNLKRKLQFDQEWQNKKLKQIKTKNKNNKNKTPPKLTLATRAQDQAANSDVVSQAGMKRKPHNTWKQEFFFNNNNKHNTWRKVFFSLIFFIFIFTLQSVNVTCQIFW